jgi:hypothetical protein
LRRRKTIISTYGAEYRGIVQYYLLAGDVWRLYRLHWVMLTPMLKTLAAKHRSTVTTMARQYKTTIDTPCGNEPASKPASNEQAGDHWSHGSVASPSTATPCGLHRPPRNPGHRPPQRNGTDPSAPGGPL